MNKQKITSYQGVLLTILVCFGSLGPITATGGSLGHDIWVVLLPLGIFGVLFFFQYLWLNKAAQGCTLDEVNRQVFGPKLSRFVSAYYLLFILFFTAFYLITAVSFWVSLEMRSMPALVYCILIVLLCIAIARLGIEVIGRTLLVFALMFGFLVVLDTALLLPEMDWQRMLPLQGMDYRAILEGAGVDVALLYGMLPLTLFFIPLLPDAKSRKKSLGFGILLAYGYIALSYIRNVLLFGNVLQLEDYPTIKALRLVEWGNSVSRMELLGLVASLSAIFLFGTVAFYVMSKLLVAMGVRKRSTALWPVGIATCLIMVYLENQANITSNKIILTILAGYVIFSVILLAFTMIKFQKTICKPRKDQL